jgi:hypothetical protein
VNDIYAIWDYVRDNPKIMGIPVSEHKGLDLLSALRDVYKTIDVDPKAAQTLLTLLANVLVATSQGNGDAIVEEVIVQESMQQLDDQLKGLLDEGRQ